MTDTMGRMHSDAQFAGSSSIPAHVEIMGFSSFSVAYFQKFQQQPMHPPELHFIGTVHSDILTIKDAPKFYAESDRTGTLEIYPQYLEGLQGIAAGQTIVVLCWFHQANREALQVYPRGDKSKGLRGVFATRSPMRPNPIAISELKVLAVDGCRIEVSGLDILNGTPIVDIKNIPA